MNIHAWSWETGRISFYEVAIVSTDMLVVYKQYWKWVSNESFRSLLNLRVIVSQTCASAAEGGPYRPCM